MKTYALSARARRDMQRIWDYGADRWDERQADRYARDLDRAFNRICKKPLLGRRCDEIREGYFRLSSGSHMIFYRLANDQVRVVRILHQSMDYERHL